MNRKSTHLAVVAAALVAAAVLLPPALVGQMDPTQNPQSPQNQNLPSGQPGMSNATGSSQTAPSTTMRDSLGAPGQTGREMADSQFIHAAAEGGMAEVKLGMLAVEKGGPEVKEFGQKMVDDHTAINKDMANVADEMGVMLPKKISKDAQAQYDKLNSLSGDAFDKEYVAYMIKAHREDFRAFRMEATTASDPTLQAEVIKALGVMRQHMALIVRLATDKGVPLPPRPQRPAGAPATPPAAAH
jgi:putative membrane protein